MIDEDVEYGEAFLRLVSDRHPRARAGAQTDVRWGISARPEIDPASWSDVIV